MEPISLNKKNNKQDNYKYNVNLGKREKKSELTFDKKSNYKRQIELFNTDNKGNSNGSRQDKTYTAYTNDKTSNYRKNITNIKSSNINHSLNQNNFDNITYNSDEYNNGNNVYHTQLIKNRNHNYLITGSTGNIAFSNKNSSYKSLSKQDSKISSDMAKTLKYFSNMGTSHASNNLDNNPGKRKENKYLLKHDFSNDKISINSDNKSTKNINNKVRNFDIQTNNIKKSDTSTSIDIKKNKLLQKINKDSLPTKIDLKYKFLEKNKSPLKVNYRYFNQKEPTTGEQIVDNNKKINGGENTVNAFVKKDEWSFNIKNQERNKDVNSYRISLNNKREINKKEYSDKYNNIKKYNNNNENLRKSNNNEEFKKFNNEKDNNNNNNNKRNINKYSYNIKYNMEKNEIPSYTTTNFSNKKLLNNKSYTNILKECTRTNLNNKSLKTPKSIKDNAIFNSHSSKSGKNRTVVNNKSFENIFINHYKPKEDKSIITSETIPNSSTTRNNTKKIPKISIDLDKNKLKEKTKSKDKEKPKNMTNVHTPTNINNKNKSILSNNKTNEKKYQLKQVSSQSNIKISRRNNDNNIKNSNNNNVKLNGIENNNNKNIIIIKQNKNNGLIFQKKINRSPQTIIKKTNLYKDNNNFELTEHTKPISRITNSIYTQNNLSPNLNENKFKTENYNYKYNNSINISNNAENYKKKADKIDTFKNVNTSGPNGTIYKKQKAVKKVPLQKTITKGKFDTKLLDKSRKEKNNTNVYDIEINNNYSIDKINNKMYIKNYKITKYYDYCIRYPIIDTCNISKIYFKSIKIPKTEICHISKINSVIYILYKNKEICYITKTRQIVKKILKPPVNEICECSKNIILIPPNIIKPKTEEKKNTQIENKSSLTPTKKNKKRKKRRKTRRLHKGNDINSNSNINNDNNNHTEDDNNEDYKEKEGTNDDISKEEKEEDNNIDNIDNNMNIEKETEKISIINNNNNNNNQYNITEENKNINNNKNNIINDKSIYKSSNEDKSAFSEKDIIITDMGKNSSNKKKLSPTTYNDDEYNDQENEDFRIASDDDLSDDKYKKKEEIKENKTEGKEIIGEFSINKKNKSGQNLTNIEKKIKALELLEKIQGKINRNKNEEIDNYLYYNIENDNYGDDSSTSNNYKNVSKNILLGTNKLNEIFNNQKILKYNQIENEDENDDIYIDSNINYSDEDTKINENKNIERNNKNNTNISKKKNNTYKKNIDYEKIGSIFDKLEGIIDRKKSNQSNKNVNINNEKCKTPLLNNGSKMKSRINDFNLKDNKYIYNSNYNDIESNNYIENESNNETYSEEKKSTNISKYKEIFNDKQQIISKLELLMNKQKNKNNHDNYDLINNYMFSSPKIESEIDSDMNINKDTPGNRKEIINNNLLISQKSINNKKYTYEEIILYKNKKICQHSSLLTLDVINHCNEMITTLRDNYSAFKKNYKDIIINTNNNYAINNNNNIVKSEKELSLLKWARKDMSKEIEEAEKYVKELNIKMSKDNYKYQIIEILNTLTVDNYKSILNKIIEMIFLSENSNNNELELNKPEYLLHNQCIFVEVVLDKATIEKGYVVLYAKLCADLFIEYIKLIKDNNNQEIKNQLISGENLKTILTSECRQRFDECVSISTLSKNLDDDEKEEIFLIFKKKFLGNMDFIAELINVKLLSQTKGFDFLDILYKRYVEIKNNDKIKYLNLEGAVTLLTKFGKIIVERQNPKHMQNLDNYMKDNIYPIVSNNNTNNKGLPNYLKFKIINLIEKKKNNWKDSLYEQSIIAKGKDNNNINNSSLYNDGTESKINIDESWTDAQKILNDADQEKEDNIIILIKNDIENYVSFLNEHNILNKKDLNEYNNKTENNDINNEYDWSISEELITKTKNELEEIIRCYIEVCIDYVTKSNTIFYCNEYIKNIINYYSVDLNKDEIEKVRLSMNDLYLNIEDICIDNNNMLEVMGYLMLILMNNNLLYFEDLDKFINEDKNKIIKISQVIKFALVHSDEKFKELYNNFVNLKLFDKNKNIFEEHVKKSLNNDFEMKIN